MSTTPSHDSYMYLHELMKRNNRRFDAQKDYADRLLRRYHAYSGWRFRRKTKALAKATEASHELRVIFNHTRFLHKQARILGARCEEEHDNILANLRRA